MSSRLIMLALLLPFTVYAQRVVIEIEDGPAIGIDAAALVRIEESRTQSRTVLTVIWPWARGH